MRPHPPPVATGQEQPGQSKVGTFCSPGHQALLGLTVCTVPARFLEILSQGGFRHLFAQSPPRRASNVEDDDEEEGDMDYYPVRRRRRRAKGAKPDFPPVPSEEGRKLMAANVFGMSDYYRDVRRQRSSRLSRKLMSRELGSDAAGTPLSTAISQVCSLSQHRDFES